MRAKHFIVQCFAERQHDLMFVCVSADAKVFQIGAMLDSEMKIVGLVPESHKLSKSQAFFLIYNSRLTF